MRNIILAMALFVLASSCSKKDINPGSGGSSKDSLPAISFLDVSYGTSGQQKADIYLPAGRNEQTKTIVVIHGGGWTSGDKSDLTSYVSEFQKRLPGYAIANLDYRLITADSSLLSLQEKDILSAVQFLKSKSKDYSVSNDFILLGVSAGAHLAMLQGYKHSDVVQPKGIISFFGPTDLSKLYNHYLDNSIPWVLKKILGATFEENPEIFQQASPINYVSSSSAPTLMLHGAADPLVPVEQAFLLHNKLDSLGVTNQLVVYPGEGHGWRGNDLVDSYNKVEAFIKGL